MNEHIFELLARIKLEYPDEVDRIQAEEERVSTLLKRKEFYDQPGTQYFLSLCRSEIVFARHKLATDRSLINNPDNIRDLWALIDGRKWVLDQFSTNYEAELEQIEMELEAELQ